MTMKLCEDKKSFKKYITDLVSTFNYLDFSPGQDGNVNENLRDSFEKIFIKQPSYPYWDPWKNGHHAGFLIRFKKYGSNRKEVLLKFVFEPRELLLELTDDDSNSLDRKHIPFSNIWKNHQLFIKIRDKILGISDKNHLLNAKKIKADFSMLLENYFLMRHYEDHTRTLPAYLKKCFYNLIVSLQPTGTP